MHIAIPGHFPQQYTLEEIETDVKGVHPSAQVNIGDDVTEEDTLVPFTCAIELRNKEATAEAIQQILSGLASLESVVWKQDIGSNAILASVENLDFIQDQLLQFGTHTRHNEQETGHIARNGAQGRATAHGFYDSEQREIPQHFGKTNNRDSYPKLGTTAHTKPLSNDTAQRLRDAITNNDDIGFSGTPEKPSDQ